MLSNAYKLHSLLIAYTVHAHVLTTGFAKGLLDVADNLSRAISAVPEQNKQVY
jgi:hypothetical protein